MRLNALPIVVLIVIVSLVSGAREAQAKTFVTISPQAGPPGSTVLVSGENFGNGEVRIEVAPARSLPEATGGGMFADEGDALSATLRLASVTSAHGVFETSVTLPAVDELEQQFGADGRQVDILAIQPLQPGHSRSPGFFITGQTFTFTDPDLSSSATNSGDSFVSLAILISAGVIAAAAAFFAVLKRRRTTW
ncbi:MAG: hypothetical protein IH866_02785 [Chloroflexi bacterium]|nr:hypothetical protein [Chloroflexota bacterium]